MRSELVPARASVQLEEKVINNKIVKRIVEALYVWTKTTQKSREEHQLNTEDHQGDAGRFSSQAKKTQGSGRAAQ